MRLTRTWIVSLPADVFDDLRSLNLLSVLYVGAEPLPNDLFDGLAALRELHWGGNETPLFESGLLKRLPKLTSLSVSIGAPTLPAGTFDGLSSLETLYLGNHFHFPRGPLATIEEGAFRGLTSLKYLSLRRNSIESLPDGLFDGLPALEEVDLSDNLRTLRLPDGVYSQ